MLVAKAKLQKPTDFAERLSRQTSWLNNLCIRASVYLYAAGLGDFIRVALSSSSQLSRLSVKGLLQIFQCKPC